MTRNFLSALLSLSFLLAGLCFSEPHPAKSADSVDHLMARSLWQKAEAELRRRLAEKPQDTHTLTLLALVSEKQGHYLEAEKFLRKAISLDPDSALVLGNLGTLYQQEERFAEAVPLYETLLRTTNPTLHSKVELATSYQQSGEYEKSLALINSLPLSTRPRKLMPVAVGDYLGLNRPEEAQAQIGRILTLVEKDPTLLPQLAKIFLKRNMVGDVSELIRITGSHQQRTATFLAVLAQIESRSGRPEEARKAATQALTLDSKCTDALIASAQLAGQARDWKTALKFLQNALQSGPPTAQTLESLIYAGMQVDDLQVAHDAALDFHQMRPDLPESSLALAAVLIRASHWGEARPLLEAVLSRYPDDKRAHLAEGIALYHLGEFDSATQHLKAGLGQGAADAEAHRTLGLLAKEKADVSSAASEMEAALAINPDDPEAMVVLGQLYLQMEKVDKARELLERAVALRPQDAQPHYQLALAYRRLGMTEKVSEQMGLFSRLTSRQVPDSSSQSVDSHRHIP